MNSYLIPSIKNLIFCFSSSFFTAKNITLPFYNYFIFYSNPNKRTRLILQQSSLCKAIAQRHSLEGASCTSFGLFLYSGYTFCFEKKKHDNIFITQKNCINYIMEMGPSLLVFFTG